jgi:hypothetical protein
VLSASAELVTPRPADSARGNPSGITCSRGLTTPARSASRSTVECSAGASPGSSSLAPTIPIATRSAYQYAPTPSSRPQNTKTEPTR